MKRKNHLMFYLTLLICAIMPLGFASFDILAGETSQAKPTLDVDDTVTKICYNDTTNKYYTTIEMALKEANSGETIYVIPNPDGVSIYNDCVIKEGVTLNLPYQIAYSNGVYSNPVSFASTHGSATSLVYNNLQARKSLLIIEEGVTLTNNGSLYVGGIQTGGQGGTNYSGSTQTSFSEIKVSKNASLISNGEITCYGYISGETEVDSSNVQIKSLSNIILNSSSSITLPFIVVEHRGGGVFMGMAASSNSEMFSIIRKLMASGSTEANLQTSPFNRFFLHNLIDINYTIYSGAKVYARADLYADNQNNAATVNLVGLNDNSFFISLTDTRSVVKGWLNSETNKNSINFYGNFKLNNLTLSLFVSKANGRVEGYINMSTSQVHFPISHYFDISLNNFLDGSSSTVDLTAQKLKFLPGSNIIINKGVNVNANSIAVYKNELFYPNGKYYVTGSVGNSLAYPSTTDANFILNGTLNVDSFGGLVKRTSITNQSFINIAVNNTVTIKEIYSTHEEVLDVIITSQNYDAADYLDCSSVANGQIITVSDSKNSTLYTNSNYKCAFVNNEFVYYLYTINYQNVSNNSINFDDYQILNTNNTYFIPDDASSLKSLTYQKINSGAEDINFLGFYFDANCTINASILSSNIVNQYLENDTLTIYCKWEKATNGITVLVEDINGTGAQYSLKEFENTTEETISLPTIFDKPNLTSGTYEVDNSINVTTYTFNGWDIEGGTFSDGSTFVSKNPSTVKVTGNIGSMITLKPNISSVLKTFNRINISFKAIYVGNFIANAETSAGINANNIINDSSLTVKSNVTINYGGSDKTNIIYAEKGTPIKITYSGETAGVGNRHKAAVSIKFIGFTNNNEIEATLSSGSTERITNDTLCSIIIDGKDLS